MASPMRAVPRVAALVIGLFFAEALLVACVSIVSLLVVSESGHVVTHGGFGLYTLLFYWSWLINVPLAVWIVMAGMPGPLVRVLYRWRRLRPRS